MALSYKNAQEILRAGIRGSDLVKQILAFSRQSEHKMIPIRVQPVLKEVMKLMRSTIPSYIEIDENIQSDCGLLMADPTQIHQVAMNIITNAFHAVESKGGKIYVELKEVSLARLEKQMLERLGYKVTMRVNSREALEAFKAKPNFFNLVISDMTMPSMTGDQLAIELKEIRANIPVIICTGFSEIINDENAKSMGIDGLLMKPIVRPELAKAVRKVLDDAKDTAQG